MRFVNWLVSKSVPVFFIYSQEYVYNIYLTIFVEYPSINIPDSCGRNSRATFVCLECELKALNHVCIFQKITVTVFILIYLFLRRLYAKPKEKLSITLQIYKNMYLPLQQSKILFKGAACCYKF